MLRRVFAAVVISLTVGLILGAQTAKAHILKLKAPTPGLKIVELENRVYHDRQVIKKLGEWKSIGGGWSAFVKYSRNTVKIVNAKHELPTAIKLLKYYRSLRGNVANWECIHNGEAAWDSTKNPIYDGGLQMDSNFQRTYGLDMLRTYGRPAWAWHRYDQMIVAERAHDGLPWLSC
jgi:hypothetical protein